MEIENTENTENRENINKSDDIISKDQEDEELIFNPYNPLNIEITIKEINSILHNYGVNYTIDNINLYKRAFIHKSYTKRPILENQVADIKIAERPYNCLPLKTKSNERLEFVGDGVLECITKFYLYKRFPKADEGFMTEKKIALVKNEHIGKLAYEMKLHKWFIMSKHAEEKNTRVNFKKLGCLFEAFLAALFLDVNKLSIKDENSWFENHFVTGPGFQMAQIFVENIYEKHVDWIQLIKTDDNYKNRLQVIIQKEFKITPDYLELNHDTENGYEMGVYICLGQEIHQVKADQASDYNEFGSLAKIHEKLDEDGKLFIFLGKGLHKIKKKAEQIACEKSIRLFEH